MRGINSYKQPMYQSILFCNKYDEITISDKEKEFHNDMLKDLNLDQMFYEIAIGTHSEEVKKNLNIMLRDTNEILYRQKVFQDLQDTKLLDGISDFCKQLDIVDHQLASMKRLVYEDQKASYFLHVVNEYCDAMDGFFHIINFVPLQSEGLKQFCKCFNEYIQSKAYDELRKKSRELQKAADDIRYQISFEGHSIVINKCGKEEEYNQKLMDTFQNFLQKERKGYCRRPENDINMNTVEIGILQCVKQMYAKTFEKIHQFYLENQSFQNHEMDCFREEVQFYLDYLYYIAPLQSSGYSFCYPQMVDRLDQNEIVQGYDLLLAQKLRKGNDQVVSNDFLCKEGERVFIVTGPNQGGKTTFSRMVGQIYYLAALGVPVPAQIAKIVLCRGVFTHFEHEEMAYNDRGKLQEELIRMHDILGEMTDHNLVIINEMLSSTSYQDAVVIGKKIIKKLAKQNSISIFVTFVDEFAKFNEENSTVSLTSQVEEGSSERTFKIKRHSATGRVYAESLSDQYHLTYDDIVDQLQQNSCR